MESLAEKVKSLAVKNKYAILVVLIGAGLMLIPSSPSKDALPPEQETVAQRNPQEELEDILYQIEGVGKVSVLLTVLEGEQTLYAYDEDDNDANGSTSTRRDAVLVTDSQRNQSGLVLQRIPPVYQGAVVVCQGGDDPRVRLAVVDAVSNATGLGADRITVLKMK